MELKAFNCVESDLQEFCEPRLVYLKSDVDKMIAELRENRKKETERDTENWNRLCVKYNKLIELKKDFCEKFKDIELEIDK